MMATQAAQCCERLAHRLDVRRLMCIVFIMSLSAWTDGGTGATASCASAAKAAAARAPDCMAPQRPPRCGAFACTAVRSRANFAGCEGAPGALGCGDVRWDAGSSQLSGGASSMAAAAAFASPGVGAASALALGSGPSVIETRGRARAVAPERLRPRVAPGTRSTAGVSLATASATRAAVAIWPPATGSTTRPLGGDTHCRSADPALLGPSSCRSCATAPVVRMGAAL